MAAFVTLGIFALASLAWSRRFPSYATSEILSGMGIGLLLLICILGIYRWLSSLDADVANSQRTLDPKP